MTPRRFQVRKYSIDILNNLLRSSVNAIACTKATSKTTLILEVWTFWYSEFQGKTSLTTYLIWGQLIIFHGMTFPPFLALLEAPLVIGL